MRITVLGAGAWGTALALRLSATHEVTLWGRDQALMESITSSRRNVRYLPEIELPETLRLVPVLHQATASAELIVTATSMAGLREVLVAVKTEASALPLLWLCKGFERETAELPHQIAEHILGAQARCGALSGPSFAIDVARGLPVAITLASRHGEFARDWASALSGERLRIYSSDDLVGVEVGGAVKNVIAIAAGISDGLGLGPSARAALITRGLAEITRLGVAMGGRMDTFLGLAGAGDLVLTCTSDQSRNRRVGLALALGERLDAIVARLGHVAEGVPTAREVLRLGKAHQVATPIAAAVCNVLDGALSPVAAVDDLMRREPRSDSPHYAESTQA